MPPRYTKYQRYFEEIMSWNWLEIRAEAEALPPCRYIGSPADILPSGTNPLERRSGRFTKDDEVFLKALKDAAHEHRMVVDIDFSYNDVYLCLE